MRLERLAAIKERAFQEYDLFRQQELFLPGLVLYLAEGSKKTEAFQFMNSDSYLVKIMIEWIMAVSDVAFTDLHFRLYIHEQYAHEDCESFWVESLGATRKQFSGQRDGSIRKILPIKATYGLRSREASFIGGLWLGVIAFTAQCDKMNELPL